MPDDTNNAPQYAERPLPSDAGDYTRLIHGGLGPDPASGAILTPIVQSTTFVQGPLATTKGYTYTRAGNPTVAAFERNLAATERALGAVCYSSGMAAISALFLGHLKSDDHVVLPDVVYGGTVRLFQWVLEGFGVRASFVDMSDPQNLAAAMTPDTRWVLLETPGNPTMKLTDIAACAAVAHEGGAKVAVDNTFLTGELQSCLPLGADVVVYSTTKHIEGHNATIGGALVTNDETLLDRLRVMTKTLGAPQAPWEAWITMRGFKTLPLRLARHSASALEVAQWLESHPKIVKVSYPFLESHPQHDLAKRQQKNGGGLMSFELAGGAPAGVTMMNAVRLCSLAENLGAVETLLTHPASMTHPDVPRAQRLAAGITDGLARLSVGLEDPSDIITDLAQALDATAS